MEEKTKYTDTDRLNAMVEAIDGKCVANIGDDYKEKAFYYNGVFTDYGCDIAKFKPLI